MNLLLDTHAFLWFATGDERLSDAARAAISVPSNRRLVSAASVWEMAIKVSHGKLDVSGELDVARLKVKRTWCGRCARSSLHHVRR